MVLLLDIINLTIPLALTYVLYILYYNMFVKRHVKKIVKAFKNNDVEKANQMQQRALKKQPFKMAILLAEIQKTNDQLAQFETMHEHVKEIDSLEVNYHIQKKDLVAYVNWARIQSKPKVVTVLILLALSYLFIILILPSPASLLVFFAAMLIFVLRDQILVRKMFAEQSNENRKAVFHRDGIIYFKHDKIYNIPKGSIQRLFETKSYLFIVINSDVAIIIPKRFMEKDIVEKINDFFVVK